MSDESGKDAPNQPCPRDGSDNEMPFTTHKQCSIRCEGSRHWAVIYGPPGKSSEGAAWELNDALRQLHWPGRVLEVLPSPEGPPPSHFNSRGETFYSYGFGVVSLDPTPIQEDHTAYLACWDAEA